MTDNFFFRSAVLTDSLRKLQEKIERPRKKREHIVMYQIGNKTKIIIK